MLPLSEVEELILLDLWEASDDLFRGPTVNSLQARHDRSVPAIIRMETASLIATNDGHYSLTVDGFIRLRIDRIRGFREKLSRVFSILRERFRTNPDAPNFLLSDIARDAKVELGEARRCAAVLSRFSVGCSGSWSNAAEQNPSVQVSASILEYADYAALEERVWTWHNQRHPDHFPTGAADRLRELLRVEASQQTVSIVKQEVRHGSVDQDSSATPSLPAGTPPPSARKPMSRYRMSFVGKNMEIGRRLLAKLPSATPKAEITNILKDPWSKPQLRRAKLLAFRLCWEFCGPTEACSDCLHSVPAIVPDLDFIKTIQVLLDSDGGEFPVDALRRLARSATEELGRVDRTEEELRTRSGSRSADEARFTRGVPQLRGHFKGIENKAITVALEKETLVAQDRAPSTENYGLRPVVESSWDTIERKGALGVKTEGDAQAILQGHVTRQQIGSILYDFVGTLGTGANGAVMKARVVNSEHLSGHVRFDAIKFFSPQDPKFRDERNLKRFQREFKILQKANHPNLIRVYDWSTLPDGTPAYSMELLPQTLAIAEKAGSLTAEQKLKLSRELFTGLAYVHALDPNDPVVHRDLKPNNLLISGDGSLKIGDFGIAHANLSDLDPEHRDLTTSGERLQNERYAAPEQREPRLGPVTPATDVFSAAVIVYEMFLGELPEQLPPGPAEALPDAVKIVLSALTDRPRDRPLAGALADALASLVTASIGSTPVSIAPAE